MIFFNKFFVFVILQVIGGYYVLGQGAIPAKVSLPVVTSPLGREAKLKCSISDEDLASSKLRYCVWERVYPDKYAQAFIVNFNEITSQPGLYSGMPGYSYAGEGFREGDCGIKISSVKTEDLIKWMCTLITDDKVYRGYVDLEKQDLPKIDLKKTNNTGENIIASSRISMDLDDVNKDSQILNQDNRPRPIITSYNDARAIIQPEIIVQTTGSDGSPQLIQEVKVESAGLQIKPRRGKLIVFE